MTDLNIDKYEYIFWDWNGTLFNDISIAVKTMNSLLNQYHINNQLESTKQYKEVFTFPVSKYYEKLGFKLDKMDWDDIATSYVKTYEKYMVESSLFDGVTNTLEAFNNLNYKQYIISASSNTSLNKQVSQFDIKDYFIDICGLKDNYAVSKTKLAINCMNNNQIDKNKLLFIGDSIHDYEVSKELNCDCLLIANGHQSKSRLETTNAYIINDLQELNKIISRCQ